SHRRRAQHLWGRDKNLREFLEAASNPRRFWQVFRKFAGDKADPGDGVDTGQLMEAFSARMNHEAAIPSSFNAIEYSLNEASAELIPDRTVDTTPEKYFNTPFMVEEVDFGKDELKRLHPGRTAAGGDEVHYRDICLMDSAMIAHLINRCLQEMDNPVVWVTTVLVAVIKKNKPAEDPKS
ncbi:hypothetical protein V5O48_018851, partial [Marasmius crinis-equi]